MAAAVLDSNRQIVWLARNESRPIWLLKLAGFHGTFFASTPAIIARALAKLYGRQSQTLMQMLIPLASQQVVGISSQGHLIAPVDLPPRPKSPQLRLV